MHICPVLEQELYDPGPVVSGGQVEGGGLPPVARVTVHVQRRQQRHQLLLVTCTPKKKLKLGLGGLDLKIKQGRTKGGISA